jgi:hypothetical protein
MAQDSTYYYYNSSQAQKQNLCRSWNETIIIQVDPSHLKLWLSSHEIFSIESEPRLTNDTIRTKTSPIKAGQIWICESVTQNRLELPPIHKIGPVLNSTTVTQNLCLCSADQPWRQHTLIACVPLRALRYHDCNVRLIPQCQYISLLCPLKYAVYSRACWMSLSMWHGIGQSKLDWLHAKIWGLFSFSPFPFFQKAQAPRTCSCMDPSLRNIWIWLQRWQRAIFM